jgi:hypothetical protein
MRVRQLIPERRRQSANDALYGDLVGPTVHGQIHFVLVQMVIE